MTVPVDCSAAEINGEFSIFCNALCQSHQNHEQVFSNKESVLFVPPSKGSFKMNVNKVRRNVD